MIDSIIDSVSFDESCEWDREVADSEFLSSPTSSPWISNLLRLLDPDRFEMMEVDDGVGISGCDRGPRLA